MKALPLLLLALLAAGCSPTPEEQLFALQRECLRHNGTPIVEDGKFLSCKREAPEKELFALQDQCVHRHGSPVVEDGKFTRCDYPWSLHIGKQKP